MTQAGETTIRPRVTREWAGHLSWMVQGSAPRQPGNREVNCSYLNSTGKTGSPRTKPFPNPKSSARRHNIHWQKAVRSVRIQGSTQQLSPCTLGLILLSLKPTGRWPPHFSYTATHTQHVRLCNDPRSMHASPPAHAWVEHGASWLCTWVIFLA